MKYVVYLPPMNGKLAGWVKGTIFTTYEETATRFATEEAAGAALAKMRQFHLARTIKACRIMSVEA
jgi:hypothetical protein